MQQRLIDANKLEEEFGCSDRDIYAKEYIREAPTVFEIPENPTNGDMVKALFGEDISNECIDYLCKIRKCGDWWNAPYKKGEASE